MVASKLLAEARQVAEVEEVASKLLAEKPFALHHCPMCSECATTPNVVGTLVPCRPQAWTALEGGTPELRDERSNCGNMHQSNERERERGNMHRQQ